MEAKVIVTIVGLPCLVIGTYFFLKHRIHRYTLLFWAIAALAIAYIRPTILWIPVGTVVGMILHECLHYGVARRWMAADDVHLNLRGMYVAYDAPYEASPRGIRVVAAAPYIVGVAAIAVYGFMWGLPLDGVRSATEFGAMGGIIGICLGTSPSDGLAILFPATFQEWATTMYEPDTAEALTLLKQRLKDALSIGDDAI